MPKDIYMSSNKNHTYADLEFKVIMILRLAYENYAKSEMTFSEFKKRIFTNNKDLKNLLINSSNDLDTI